MENRSLTHRRDNRTVEEFEKQINHFESNEITAFDILVEDLMIRNKNPIVTHGLWGNKDGGVITEYKGDKLSDFYLEFKNGKVKMIEIKVHSEKWNVFTIKSKPLDGYIKENATVAVIQETGYVLLNPTFLQDLKDGVFGGSSIYSGFSPNDPAFRLHANIWGEYKKGNIPTNYGRRNSWEPKQAAKIKSFVKFTG